MDKALIKKRFSRARTTYLHEASVQHHIARQMNNAIQSFIPENCRKKVLEIGCGTGTFTRIYLRESETEKLILNDICTNVITEFDDIITQKKTLADICFISGDAESLDFPHGMDMITSCSAIQWFENPLYFMRNCINTLNDNGFLAVSTFGPENMKEIKQITHKSLPYIPLETIIHSLKDVYDIIYSSEEKLTLRFESPVDVLKHLKKTGVNGISSEVWTKGRLNEFSENYRKQFTDSTNGIPLTYNPIYIICRKKAS